MLSTSVVSRAGCFNSGAVVFSVRKQRVYERKDSHGHWIGNECNTFFIDFILGFIDVEGNYFVVKSYEYTSMLSAMLIDCWSTPVCVILSVIFLKVRFRWVQYLGIFIALVGLGMLVGSDVITGKNYDAIDPVRGDLYCLLGATLYGFSNVGEEYMARKHPLYEVIGCFTL